MESTFFCGKSSLDSQYPNLNIFWVQDPQIINCPISASDLDFSLQVSYTFNWWGTVEHFCDLQKWKSLILRSSYEVENLLSNNTWLCHGSHMWSHDIIVLFGNSTCTQHWPRLPTQTCSSFFCFYLLNLLNACEKLPQQICSDCALCICCQLRKCWVRRNTTLRVTCGPSESSCTSCQLRLFTRYAPSFLLHFSPSIYIHIEFHSHSGVLFYRL